MDLLADRRPAWFTEAFAQEVLGSERLRATILAWAAAAGIVFVIAHSLLLESRIEVVIQGPSPLPLVLGTAAVFLAYELTIRRVLRRCITRKTSLPSGLRYVNAFVEISAVTLVLFYVGEASDNPTIASAVPAVLVYFLLLILSTIRLDAAISLFTGTVAALQYAMLAMYSRSVVPEVAAGETFISPSFYAEQAVVIFAGGFVAASVARHIGARVRHTLATLEERDRILKVFGQHTSPEIVKEILESSPETAGERKRVSVMFMDIRGFAAFSESRDPEDVVAYLNRILDGTIGIVNRHGGTIHQLLGDGFLAIFGAPISHGEDARNAVDAAMAIIDHIKAEVGVGRIPPTRIGIGVHAGEALLGMVGSAIHKEYKATGDVVNIAARLEQLNKTFESQLLVSQEVLEAVEPDRYEAVDLGTVSLRGYVEPVHVFKLA